MKQKNVILMVVAVGCGLVAAFLTSQMAAKPVEQIEVVVAAGDLPVGTVFTKESLEKTVKLKKVPKDALPPAFVLTKEELLEKRLSRPMRAEETINPNDLNKGITLPDGHDLVSLSIGPSQAASGFVLPGCRVDVMASLRLGNTLKVFDLLVNTLVVNVNHDMASTKNGVYPDINQVGFALKKKEAAALELARARGCSLTLRLRNQNRTAEDDAKYNLDQVIKLLEDDKNPQVVEVTNDKDKPVAAPTPTPVVVPQVKTVKVLVATKTIAPNTEITKDLIEDAFTLKEFPEGTTGTALEDLLPALSKAFPNGVPAGVWVTPEMIGQKTLPSSPQDIFLPTKPAEPAAPEAAPEPKKVTPEQKKPEPPKPVYVDVAVHGASGTIVHRYQKTAAGLKKVAELTPAQAAVDAVKPEAPPAPPENRQVD